MFVVPQFTARRRSSISVGSARNGFSIIELLIVIGILALLMAILMPSIAKARRQARLTACASNLREIATACANYAVANEGRYPDLTITSATGGNMWDVSKTFVKELGKQGVSFEKFLCPASQEIADAKASLNTYSYFSVIQYNVWIPRKNGADIIPPAPTYVGSRFKIVQPPPTAPFAGPANMADRLASMNPIITDIIGSTNAVTPPANADVSGPDHPYTFANLNTVSSNHMDGTRVLGVNQAFADGHVEVRAAHELRPWFLGNYWNWR